MTYCVQRKMYKSGKWEDSPGWLRPDQDLGEALTLAALGRYDYDGGQWRILEGTFGSEPIEVANYGEPYPDQEWAGFVPAIIGVGTLLAYWWFAR
jgi:hypothetical protein